MHGRFTLAPPRDLTLPEPGSTTARDVLSHAIGRLLREVRPLVRARASLAPPADVASFDRLLGVMQKEQLGPLASVLRLPNLGALLRTLRREPTRADGDLLSELIGLTSFELAVHGALPFEVRLSRFPPRVLSMAAEAALDLPPDVDAVVLTSGSMRITRRAETFTVDLDALRDRTPLDVAGLSVRRPFVAIDGATRLAIEDNNPLALDEAHPDKVGNAVDLGDASIATWVDALRSAFELVATYLPLLRSEMDLYVHQVVPVGVDADRHLSASYREAIGTVYMTLHPSPMTMVEGLVHEFQHNKLNALLELDAVLENAFSPLYASPVRPDRRPLHGVLLATHAFLPIARLYELMIADGHPLARHETFRERLASIVEINREGAAVVLAHAVPTPIGAVMLDEMRRLAGRPIAGGDALALDLA